MRSAQGGYGSSVSGTPTPTLRCLFLCNAHEWGGAEAYVCKVAAAFAAYGHRCWIASPPGSPLLGSASLLEGVTALPFDLGPKLGRRTVGDFVLRSRRYSERVRDLLIECQYSFGVDVLHLQFKKEQLLATPVADRLAIPVVWTEHGALPAALARVLPARSLYRRAARTPHTILCVSGFVKEDLRRHGVPTTSLVVCHNGIAVTEPAGTEARARVRDEFGIPLDARVAGIVARLTRIKGHHDLLAAAPTIVRRVPNVRFLIVGDGPERERLRRQADRLGVGARVTFAGHRHDVPSMLAAMDVIAAPSLVEGHPFSVLEAMAAMRPVVGTRVGGIPEALGHGQAGILVTAGDRHALARELASLLGSPERCAILGIAGRRRVLCQFTADTMMQTTENAFLGAAWCGHSPSRTTLPIAIG
jgi:glycosyltransferase involved in cell wall biosynthesis